MENLRSKLCEKVLKVDNNMTNVANLIPLTTLVLDVQTPLG